MNEQNSKKLTFNKSTLLSLKAELLRKQEEVKEKKQLPQHKLENFKPAPARVSEEEDQQNVKVTLKDRLDASDAEELEAHRKSKAALEKKVEIYNHLVEGPGDSLLGDRFLVDFKNKKPSVVKEPTPPPPSNDDNDALEDDSEEWLEFTDCLGRTRKCHRNDLKLYKKRDMELMKSMLKESGSTMDAEKDETEPEISKEKPFLVQKTNDYLQTLRDKWDQKEQELLAKDRDIHYQDLLFDEARIHGVGYYAFSTDDAERQKQMDELKRVRAETERAQRDAELARSKRDELLAARVAAARARRRLRAGLPPEDPDEEKQKYTECLLQFLTQQKDEAAAKAKEEERIKKEALEKEKQKLREEYVREWDIGKEGVDKPKKFKEMSQEEYVEQQRSKRIDEFAPPTASSSSQSLSRFDEKGRFTSDNTETTSYTPPVKTWSDVRPEQKALPPPDIGSLSDTNTKGLYFSSAKNKSEPKYRNFVKPVPIVNELDVEDDSQQKKEVNKRKSEFGVEIMPPPTYDYYGPVPKHARAKKPFDSDLTEAFAQGEKSLETRESKRQLSDQYDFIM